MSCLLAGTAQSCQTALGTLDLMCTHCFQSMLCICKLFVFRLLYVGRLITQQYPVYLHSRTVPLNRDVALYIRLQQLMTCSALFFLLIILGCSAKAPIISLHLAPQPSAFPYVMAQC